MTDDDDGYPTDAAAQRTVLELIAVAQQGDLDVYLGEIFGRLAACGGALLGSYGPIAARDAFIRIADTFENDIN